MLCAGVGKSTLIKAIYQTVIKRCLKIPGNNPNEMVVSLMASTGEAAFNIGGSTIHSMLQILVNQQSKQLILLNNDNRNTLYSMFTKLKLIIIDEISMCGSKMLNYINSRLQQIFCSNSYFANIPIIVFGDFYQLPPVGDRWIFESFQSDPYSTTLNN